MISQLAIYERTTCACRQCRSPCVNCTPGATAPGEIAHIAWHIGLEDPTTEFVDQMFEARPDGPGAATDEFADGETPVLRPRAKPDGRCVFLGADDHCTIYPVRPFECSRVNPCDPASGAAAMKMLGKIITASPAYVALCWQIWKLQNGGQRRDDNQTQGSSPA